MQRLLRLSTVVLLGGTLLLSGCKKKKPQVPPPQAQAPTITQPAQTTAPQTTAPPATSPGTETGAKPATTSTTTTKPKSKPSAAHPKHSAAPHKSSTTASSGTTTPPNTANPAAPKPATPAAPTKTEEDVQISAANPAESQLRNETNQLLATAEANLKAITRALTNDEQNSVAQVRNYVAQARAALRDFDLDRAHNLAMKAHLLSSELVKQ